MRRIGMLALVAGGCGGQIGTEDGYGCLVDATEAISDTTATPDGFAESVDAMLARVLGDFDGDATHPDESTEYALLTLVQEGDPEVERRAWKGDGGSDGMEADFSADCFDDVRIPVTIGLTVGDALDETFEADVRVDTEGTAAFVGSIDFGALHGDATPYGFDPDDMAKTSLQVSASTSDTGTWQGNVSFVGESEPSGTGPDSTVSATSDPWAEFGVTPVVVH